MRQEKQNRKNRFLFLVIALLLLLNASLGFILIRQSGAKMIALIQGRMMDASNTAAAMLDGDLLSRVTADDVGTAPYQQVLDTLSYFQDNTNLDYIYCIRDLGDKNFVLSVDPTAEDGEYGAPVVYTDALYRASLGIPSVDDKPSQDQWGTYYSAYSPVFTSSGEVGGIVGVDFNAEWYDQQVSDLLKTVFAVAVVSLVVGVLIVAVFARRNRMRYRHLHGQLNDLAGRVNTLIHVIENETFQSLPEGEQSTPSAEEEENWQGEDIDALGMKIMSIQDEIRDYIERFHEQAYRDGLTGVGNRTAYLDAIRDLESQILEKTAAFAVAIFDLNGLKLINDKYGHERGDLALMDAADLLKGIFGKENSFRIGGDEFAAVMKQTSVSEMELLFDRLDAEVDRVNQDERPYVVPLALAKGAAVYTPGEDADFNSVFNRADRAMYEDKKAYYTTVGDRRRQS